MWQQLKDPSGRTYYFNTTTSESKWEKPESLMTDLEKVLLKFNLKQFENNGSVYYYNELTKESFWDIPEEVSKEIERLKEERELKQTEKDTQTAKPKEENKEIEEEEEEREGEAEPKQEEPTNEEPKKEVILENYHKRPDVLSTRANNTDPGPLHQMFKDHNVDATWSFNRIISVCTADPRYWSNSLTPSQKKSVFEEYLKSRSKEELIKENSSIEKFQKAFISLLDNMDIRHYSRWKTVKDKLIQEPIYNLYFISESVKKRTFLDYRESIIKDHEAKEQELVSQAKEELAEYFKSLQITVDTTWESLIVTIANDERFKKNKHFGKLNQNDLLAMYKEHLHLIRSNLNAQIKEQDAKNYRSDRKAREAFSELLTSLHSEGILTADIKWSELYDFIMDDERYQDMLGRHGSSPLTLFNEFITQENLIINSLMGRIEGTLINDGFKIMEDSEEQKAKFIELVSVQEKLEELNEGRRDVIYEKLIKQYQTEQMELRSQKLKEINSKIENFIKSQFDTLLASHENVNALSKDQIDFPDFFTDLSPKDLKSLQYTNNDDIFKHLKIELIKANELKAAQSKKRSAGNDLTGPAAKRVATGHVKPAPVELDYWKITSVLISIYKHL